MFSKIKAWIKEHKKGVLITVTVLAIAGTVAIVLMKGKKVSIPLSELAEKVVPEAPKAAKTVAEVAPETVTLEVNGVMKTFQRAEFIRQLHEGWHASPAKLAQAMEMGIELKPGETIVNACKVMMKVS